MTELGFGYSIEIPAKMAGKVDNLEGRESGLFWWESCKPPRGVRDNLPITRSTVHNENTRENMLNQNHGNFYQFNIKKNKFSLIPGDFPVEKLIIVGASAFFIFLSIMGLIILKLI